MKVCTDSCITGAWVADYILSNHVHALNCLDIGTGTGLLALMLAQKTGMLIDGIEIDNEAFLQASENFAGSPWNKRLHAIHADVTTFPAIKEYDFIISNPPFFENDLRSGNINRNVSLHDESLNLKQLITCVHTLLSVDGYFAILLPWKRVSYFEMSAAEQNIFPHEKLLIRQTPGHHFFRCILICRRTKKDPGHSELTIKDERGNYTIEFANLLNDYYLSL